MLACFLLSQFFRRQSLFLLSTSQLHTTSHHDRCLHVPGAVYTHPFHNTIRCILSSDLCSSSVRSPRRRGRPCGMYLIANERGVRKTTAGGRIWQALQTARDRFRIFPVFPFSLRICTIHVQRPAVEQSLSLHPAIADVYVNLCAPIHIRRS